MGDTPGKGSCASAVVYGGLDYVKKKHSGNVNVCGKCVRACSCGQGHTSAHIRVLGSKTVVCQQPPLFFFPGLLSSVLSGITHHTHTRMGSQTILGAFSSMGGAQHLE